MNIELIGKTCGEGKKVSPGAWYLSNQVPAHPISGLACAWGQTEKLLKGTTTKNLVPVE